MTHHRKLHRMSICNEILSLKIENSIIAILPFFKWVGCRVCVGVCEGVFLCKNSRPKCLTELFLKKKIPDEKRVRASFFFFFFWLKLIAST